VTVEPLMAVVELARRGRRGGRPAPKMMEDYLKEIRAGLKKRASSR